jgi:hypothetical protein
MGKEYRKIIPVCQRNIAGFKIWDMIAMFISSHSPHDNEYLIPFLNQRWY